MAQAETESSELGRKLLALMREHGLPEMTTRFSVHVEMDAVIRVDCDFIAHKPEGPGGLR